MAELPSLPARFEYRLDLAKHVTPRLLKDQPVHRWFYFPHSFSPQLVEILLDKWQLPDKTTVLDPFVGAGTTIYTASQKGYNALGTDISPLSIFVSNSKVRIYDPEQVRQSKNAVIAAVKEGVEEVNLQRAERLQRAFTDAEFLFLKHLQKAISTQPVIIRDLLLLALLRVQQNVSRAVPDGGWFRWVEQGCQAPKIIPAFAEFVEAMLIDLEETKGPHVALCEALEHDARQLEYLQTIYPELAGGCQAIITSPPYPNRHDYSRIFQIELLTLGLSEAEIFTLRYESLRSNVEARPPMQPLPNFEMPALLADVLNSLPEKADKRIDPMLRGYFEDMNAVLYSAYQILASGGYVALVVGNVRHAGVMVPVDEILLVIGESLGYRPLTSWVARLRGNSAQQMGRYGREPARESIVMLQKP
jgi:tRNA G10  N-methylase Trm11